MFRCNIGIGKWIESCSARRCLKYRVMQYPGKSVHFMQCYVNVKCYVKCYVKP